MSVKIAVVGAGNLARLRARAFLKTGRARICAVASRHIETARRLGAEIGCEDCFDDYRRIVEARPDAVLVEVPHGAQDAVTLWALENGLNVMVGGCLATLPETADRIVALSRERGLVVEAGYEARYAADWQAVKDALDGGHLGRMVAVRAVALWDGDPRSWYYSERESGGMPLTHMTYCFINPLRYLLGEPRCVSAFANRVRETASDMIEQETCIANWVFPGEVLCSMTAGFVKPPEMPAWSVELIGTQGGAEIRPLEGKVRIYGSGGTRQHDLPDAPQEAFVKQAEAFLDALAGDLASLRCPASAAAPDVHAAQAVVESCRRGGAVVSLCRT